MRMLVDSASVAEAPALSEKIFSAAVPTLFREREVIVVQSKWRTVPQNVNLRCSSKPKLHLAV